MRKAFTIALGESLSDAIDLGTGRMVGIEMPAAALWDAANFTFQVSGDNSTFMNLYTDGGAEVTLTADAGRFISLRDDARAILSRFRYLKVRSGTSGGPVVQTAERSLAVICSGRA